MRRALPLALSLLTTITLPATATARPFSREPDDKPWVRGTLMPSFGLGGSFGSRGGGSLLVAAGLSYFVVNNLGFGLSLRNFTTFLPSSLKADFPGIEKQIPTNEFSVIPGMTLVLYRSFRFSPYVAGGVGPVFLNHKRGVVGEWNAGPGFLLGIGRRMAIDIGVTFSMRFPGDKCDAAYSYAGTGGNVVFFGACGLRWGIRAGLVFGFGVGRKRHQAPPPEDPYYTPPPQPAPAPSPGYAPPNAGYAPPPEPAPPPGPPPAPPPGPPPEPVAPPLEGPAPPPAAAPAETVPVTPPPADAPPVGESVPVSPPG